METIVTPKTAFADLLAMWDLTGKDPDYDREYYPLLKLIDDKKWYSCSTHPTLKEVAAMLNVKTHILNNWILAIYTPWLDLDKPPRIIFKTVVEFHFMSFRQTIVFESQDISFLPRKGESVNSDYFRNYLGTQGSFYVESISHRFKRGEHRISVFMEIGLYNEYWEFRKDEAFIKEEISDEDYFMKDDWDLKKQLKISPHFARLKMQEENERQNEAKMVVNRPRRNKKNPA